MLYHIRALHQIRGALDNSTAATVVSALVSARLDYVNSIPYGTSTKQINRLQRVQNVLARVIVPNWPLGSTSLHLLKQLHWLPVVWCIKFKIPTLMFKAFETTTLWPSCYVTILLPELYTLPHPIFFIFHVPTSSLVHALFVHLLPHSGTHCLAVFVSVNL